uniref:Flagellar associated protein n=2 Tax=Chlamydomonas reinhardtii TaxID=3055 RepID=A0ABF7PHH0_CHLRE|nr:Chain 7C, FAP141 [Chlamydomonas reinhardtii]8GLV_7C Chain 7C, Flagellar associated protein [Chlamydomonas reinhardtii]8GLV_Hj Chain Hj, Flagellar associated protein [Chlamydomonas reinhardtii]|eukprot:XP_001691365.1 flagellar associated protein [Chlamydomonas reinhardtii]
MSYMPRNVRETVERNEMYARLQKQNKEELRTAIIAQWTERDLQRPPPSTGLTKASITLAGTSSDRDAGIKSGVQTVKAARQARLRELFEREALMYEKELNARGLSLVKPRD